MLAGPARFDLLLVYTFRVANSLLVAREFRLEVGGAQLMPLSLWVFFRTDVVNNNKIPREYRCKKRANGILPREFHW